MAPVTTKPVDREVEVLVEIVRGIDEKEEKRRLVPVEGLSPSKKNLLLINRTRRPPKNLILVEGDPVDTMGVPKKREMRNFPPEDLLSAKIKMANGTDYSNNFIEQHFNRRSSEKRRLKRISKQIDLVNKKTKKKKKLSTDYLGLGVLNKEDIIDLTDITEDDKIAGRKTVGINPIDKFDSKSNDVTVCRYGLVPYSSSDDEGDNADRDSSPSEENSTRQYLISEGLVEEKFKFKHKTITYGRKKKFN